MDTHVKVLGILNIVYGALGIGAALLVMLIFGGVTSLTGREGDPDATLVVGITGAAIVAILVVTSLPAVIIGYGLYKRLAWGRVGGIVLSILSLIAVPFGTALGIYGLWVLFSKDGARVFDTAAPA